MELKNRIIKNLGRLYPTKKSKQKRTYLLVLCPKCNKEYRCEKYVFMQGKSEQCKSCKSKIHGNSRDRIYRIWQKMKERCYGNDKRNKLYYKNIEICKEWKNDFKKFRDWAIDNGYQNNLTIDRKNNNGNYEPSNCRWTTMEVQARNTRKIYSHNTSGYRGVSRVGKIWEARISINNKTVHIGKSRCRIKCAFIRDKYIIENNLEHTLNFERINNV